MPKVFIGADHRGFALKEKLVEHLRAAGYLIDDVGAASLDAGDDYPDFAIPVARAVSQDPSARGLLLCGSGMGMDVAANKVRGVRATVGYSVDAARHARSHDDVNVLTLAADTDDAASAIAIADAFLSTAFDGAERNERRLAKIAALEAETMR